MSNKNQLPEIIQEFISAVNSHDGNALVETFTDDALVKNHLGSFWGKEAITKYSDFDLIQPKVTFKTDEIKEHHDGFMVTALTDGNYDKSKAPDPTYLDYFFSVKNNKIIRMFIYLNVEKSINYKF